MAVDRVEFARNIVFRNQTEIYELIKRLERLIKCVGCGRLLSEVPYSIEAYDHSDGWLIESIGIRKWIYVECKRCGYQNALWKLLRQLEPAYVLRVLDEIRSKYIDM